MPWHAAGGVTSPLHDAATKAAPEARRWPRAHVLQDVHPSPWALRRIATHPDVGGCAALRQLLHVADEKWRRSLGGDDNEAEALLRRLVEWPLPVLTRCASIIRVVRGMLRGWIASEEATLPSMSATPPPTYYRRLYNICLWQRRHPLFILTPVLDAFGETLSCEDMDGMLEALSQHLVGGLKGVPHLLRCDVLMTYPRLSFSRQQQLMEDLRTGYPAVEACELPPSPEFYLADHVHQVPPRFGVHDLRADQYEELRRAFELHKRAGVRRLFSCKP